MIIKRYLLNPLYKCLCFISKERSKRFSVKHNRAIVAKLPQAFFPQGTFELLRLGRQFDGGYLAEKNSIYNAKSLLSFGVALDWSFERDFLNLNKVHLEAYDNANYFMLFIKRLKSRIFRFYRLLAVLIDFFIFFNSKNRILNNCKVGNDKDAKSLKEILAENKLQRPVFIKCDIEGAEYHLLDDIIDISDDLTGMAIEFHDVDCNMDKITDFIKRFPLKVVHLHPNNGSKISPDNIPCIIEMSFAKDPVEISSQLPCTHPLDDSCNPAVPDIVLYPNREPDSLQI